MTREEERARRNMYDCLPCPKCKSRYRSIEQEDGTLQQVCGDCDFVELLDDFQKSEYGR